MKIISDGSKKDGAILIIVMVILIAFTLLVTGLLQMSSYNAIESSLQLRQTQARWIAEAGLEKVIAMILASKDFRDDLSSSTSLFSEDFEDETDKIYDVYISKVDVPDSQESVFTIISTGIVVNAAATATAGVQVEFTGAPGISQAILGLGGESQIDANNQIFAGPVYQSGTLDIGANTEFENLIEAADNGTVISGKVAPDQVVTVDEINFIPLDRTPYETLINYAANTNNSDVTQGNTTYTTEINFNEEPLIYVNGNVSIQADIVGSGTLVATGTINFEASHVNVEGNSQIVANGDITFANQNTLGNNTEVFTMQNMTLASGGGFSGDGITLMAIEDITIAANIQPPDEFKGIIYAEGRVDIAAGVQILRGTIIAWDGFHIGSNTEITYDPSVFAEPNPFNFGNSFVRTQRLLWQQTPFE